MLRRHSLLRRIEGRYGFADATGGHDLIVYLSVLIDAMDKEFEPGDPESPFQLRWGRR